MLWSHFLFYFYKFILLILSPYLIVVDFTLCIYTQCNLAENLVLPQLYLSIASLHSTMSPVIWSTMPLQNFWHLNHLVHEPLWDFLKVEISKNPNISLEINFNFLKIPKKGSKPENTTKNYLKWPLGDLWGKNLPLITKISIAAVSLAPKTYKK